VVCPDIVLLVRDFDLILQGGLLFGNCILQKLLMYVLTQFLNERQRHYVSDVKAVVLYLDIMFAMQV
jgi:hypothetical protein